MEFNSMMKNIGEDAYQEKLLCAYEDDNEKQVLGENKEKELCKMLVRMFNWIGGLEQKWDNTLRWIWKPKEWKGNVSNEEKELQSYLRCLVGRVTMTRMLGTHCDLDKVANLVKGAVEGMREMHRIQDRSGICDEVDNESIGIGGRLIWKELDEWINDYEKKGEIGFEEVKKGNSELHRIKKAGETSCPKERKNEPGTLELLGISGTDGDPSIRKDTETWEKDAIKEVLKRVEKAGEDLSVIRNILMQVHKNLNDLLQKNIEKVEAKNQNEGADHLSRKDASAEGNNIPPLPVKPPDGQGANDLPAPTPPREPALPAAPGGPQQPQPQPEDSKSNLNQAGSSGGEVKGGLGGKDGLQATGVTKEDKDVQVGSGSHTSPGQSVPQPSSEPAVPPPTSENGLVSHSSSAQPDSISSKSSADASSSSGGGGGGAVGQGPGPGQQPPPPPGKPQGPTGPPQTPSRTSSSTAATRKLTPEQKTWNVLPFFPGRGSWKEGMIEPFLPYFPLAPVLIGISAVTYLLWKYFALPGKRRRYKRAHQVRGPTLGEQIMDHVDDQADGPHEYTLVKERKQPRSAPKEGRTKRPKKQVVGRRAGRRVGQRTIIDIHLEVLDECQKRDLHSTKEDFFEILVREFMESEFIKE
ncbi:SICA antigen [Plasmodium coatneyi]|uniref:SICA antigen n=1 Tax=Plasmodium coatneyi TaxID=208452 RepID=A0A1B1E016_9APIC|nr:SICA antigen [Plasmodium coatneyi]ANQ08373.1 SICA antigen [Plasmodium coatneyi]